MKRAGQLERVKSPGSMILEMIEDYNALDYPATDNKITVKTPRKRKKAVEPPKPPEGRAPRARDGEEV